MRHASKSQVAALLLSLTATLLIASRLSAADGPPATAAKPGARPAMSSVPGSPSTRGPNFINPYAARPFIPGPSPAAASPSPQKSPTTAEKLKQLGSLLGRALDVAVSLLSGNETELFSKNQAALLSGNKPEILSGNKADLLSGNKPEILSGNKPKLLSGNKAALLSGNKPEILSGNKPNVLSGNKTPILSGNTFSFFSNIKIENVKIEIHFNNSCNDNVAPGASVPPRMPSALPTPVRPGMAAPRAMERAPQAIVPDTRAMERVPRTSVPDVREGPSTSR